MDSATKSSEMTVAGDKTADIIRTNENCSLVHFYQMQS